MKLLKNLKYLLLILLLALSGFGLYQEMTNWGLNRIQIVHQPIQHSKIPASFEDVSVVFFTDVHYAKFMNKERLEPFIDTIKQLDPDIVLFGGDLFDHPSVKFPTQQTIDELTQLLASIPARLAKIAVLGNHDHESSKTVALVQSILEEAGFMVLINQEVLVYNQDNNPISVVGIYSQLYGNPNVTLAFENHQSEHFTIVLSHTPDIADQIPVNKAQLQLSGHSHGGQISLPIIGPILRVPYAQKYAKGTYDVNGMRLDVSNGIGTTRMDFRLFASPQIHHYILKQNEN